MKDSLLYRIVRPFVRFFTLHILRVKIIGDYNIPKDGRVILAGSHTSIFDPLVLVSSTYRSIHFLAKIELFKGIKGIIFSNLGLISVDRKNHSFDSLGTALEVLKKDGVIGIFPEGTISKTSGVLLPFKRGAVTMSYLENTYIVPFGIKGKYGLFSKTVITFGEAYKVSSLDIDYENRILRDKIYELMR